jgi:serine/threonine protein kinase
MALRRDPSIDYAAKELLKDDLVRGVFAEDWQKNIAKEVDALKVLLNHPHIIKFMGLYIHNHRTFLVIEPYADGTLAECLLSKTRPDVPHTKVGSMLLNWMLDLLGALRPFHDIGEGIRRHIKPENIFIKSAHICFQILDWQKLSCSSNNPASIEGTHMYMAPDQGYDKKYG